MDEQFGEGIGANKISDGLYIGDELASKDIDTIVINHITHIVNCSAGEVPNHLSNYGIEYLSFEWTDTDRDVILDPHEHTISRIAAFIEEARSMGESCLIHTREGYSTSFTVFAGYFMLRFQWTLYKVLEFLNSRVSRVEIKGNCFRQLKLFEERLARRYPLTNDWTAKPSNPDELIIRNTYLNSLRSKHNQPLQVVQKSKKKTLTWSAQHHYFITEDSRKADRPPALPTKIKSILKGSEQQQQQPIKPTIPSRDNSTGRKENSKEALDESRNGSNYKLSIKKKLPASSANATPPLPPSRPPEQRKIIHLVAGAATRSGSERKIEKEYVQQQPFQLAVKERKVDEKVASNRNSYLSKQAEQYREAANDYNARRVLKSEMNDKEKGVESLFSNIRSEQLQQKSKKDSLNKSAENLEDEHQRIRFLTEMADMPQKEDLAKRLMKRVDRSHQADKENMHAGGVKPKHVENDQLFRSGQGGLLSLNLRVLNGREDKTQQSEATRKQSSEDRQPETKKNNFMEERPSEKPSSSLSKPVRAESPCVRPSSSTTLTKFKPSLKKSSQRASSPMVHSQNNLSVKDANMLLGSIFSKDLYKPKWKF